MIEVWVAGSDDWWLWRELRLEALADAPDAFSSRLADWQGDGDREERWRARLNIPGSCNVIAVLDGRPVGMVSGFPSPQDGVAELGTLWVSRAVRGRGIGNRLVRAVEQWAMHEGAEVLLLTVSPDNEPAIALYRRNGFDDAEYIGADGRQQCRMAKTLQS